MKSAEASWHQVFLTSSDGIELMALPESKFVLDASGILALAHLSSLDIGRTHGVYRVVDPERRCESDVAKPADMQEPLVLEYDAYLQKPSLEEMEAAGVVKNAREGNGFVYTDGTYFFDHLTVNAFLEALAKIEPLTFELCAWADILPYNTSHLSAPTSAPTASSRARDIIHGVLRARNIPIHTMVINASRFYHMGTMTEYLIGCCQDDEFRTAMGIAERDERVPVGVCVITADDDARTTFEALSTIEICAPAILDRVNLVGAGEHVRIGSRSILSNLDVVGDVTFPDRTCMFTVRCLLPEHLNVRGGHAYVTFVFATDDDMKATVPFEKLKFFTNIPISQVMCPLRSVDDESDGHTKVSLWNAQAFPMLRSKKQAEDWALWMLRKVQSWIGADIEKGGCGKDKDYPSQKDEILGLVSLKTCMELCT